MSSQQTIHARQAWTRRWPGTAGAGVAAAARVFLLAAAPVLAAAMLLSPAPASAAGDLASATPATPSGNAVAARPALQRRMEQVVAAGAPGIVALIDDASKPRPWTDARGKADLRRQRPMRPEHRFRAGSVTKSFVATVALQLVDEGRLSLTDTVEGRLPGILPYGDQVTLRQLLNHTSGVPEAALVPRELLYQGERFRSWAPREVVGLITGEPQLFPSGTGFKYSNTNYVLAGLMIEQATGRRLGGEIRRRILRPLRLRDTSFPVDFPSIAGPSARGYSRDHDDRGRPVGRRLRDLTVANPSGIWAGGNMVSDVDDIARFFRALLGGRLLSPAGLAEMKADDEPWVSGQRHGLGLHVMKTPCGPIFGHIGGVPGFLNWAFSSEDGTRQFGLMINAEEAPAPVDERFKAAAKQAVREAFAGTGRCRTGV